jgi:hypothetical protein
VIECPPGVGTETPEILDTLIVLDTQIGNPLVTSKTTTLCVGVAGYYLFATLLKKNGHGAAKRSFKKKE